MDEKKEMKIDTKSFYDGITEDPEDRAVDYLGNDQQDKRIAALEKEVEALKDEFGRHKVVI